MRPTKLRVGGGKGALALGEDAHVTTEARAAGWRGNDAASVEDGLGDAFFHAGFVDILGARDDDESEIWRNFFCP